MNKKYESRLVALNDLTHGKPVRFLHFKGNTYKAIGIATHSETGEALVIYFQEGSNVMYARPLEMFMSKVDCEKYPDVEQVYRFEVVRS